ncbi:MAG: glycosyltransferase family 2 protein [Bdellovibrionaceae bacterium]|nr:glycosyltransferase family 2 protein [Pseudobdellovibrionaceae bacterium]
MSTATRKVIRHYYIPTMPTFKGYSWDWLSLSGGLRLKPVTLKEFENTLRKAKQSDYSAVVLPENTLDHPRVKELLALTEQQGLKVTLQLVSSGLLFSIDRWRELRAQYDLSLDLVLDDVPQDLDVIKEEAALVDLRFVLPGIKDAPIWKKLKQLPNLWYQEMYFYFPYMGTNKKIFKPRQIREKIAELQKLYPEFEPRVLSGMDVFEPRIDAHSDLESLVKPVLQTGSATVPAVSVVIPAYNNGRYVLNTLRHLNEQTEDPLNYEVIVVDDGSSDETSELILQTYKSYKFPFTYIYYPRFKKRSMGDSQFRAGLARNLGVKWARSELLAFLDADIIVPPHYIKDLLRLHTTHDVVQWRRDYLKQDVPSFTIRYSDIQKTKNCFIPEGGYWEQFYQDAAAQSWPELKDYWKYTCTYGLSMPKKLFKEVGWFRKTYCFYGFEDTDLGLQLMRQGAKFYFHDVSVFHLFHETQRSEFRNSFFHRQKLLKNTARIFYHNTLDPEAYRVFKYLLSPFL